MAQCLQRRYGDGGSGASAAMDRTWPAQAAAGQHERQAEPKQTELPDGSEPSSALARPADLPKDFPIPDDAVIMTSSNSVNEGKIVILLNFTTKSRWMSLLSFIKPIR